MQVKCEVFSRFASSVDFSSGEPLGGMEASTVGADLCVRPYTSYVSTTIPRIKRCNTSSIIDRRTQKDLARGPTNHSRGSEGQSPERPTDARRHLIYRPLVGRTRRIYSSSPTSRQGRSSPLYTPLCPPVVRSFAPSTGGYDSSDRKRSLPPSPALVLLHNNETSNPLYQSVTSSSLLSKFICK